MDASSEKHFALPINLDLAMRSICSSTKGGRSENQDNFTVISSTGEVRCFVNEEPLTTQLSEWPHGYFRLAVMDGMGGRTSGRQASEAVSRGLLGIPACQDPAAFFSKLDDMHRSLRRHFTPQGTLPGSTLTLLDVDPSGLATLFHVGDSRLIAMDAGGVRVMTIDHVPATDALLHGDITPRQWQRDVFWRRNSSLQQAFILGGDFTIGPWDHDCLYVLQSPQLPAILSELGDRRQFRLDGSTTYFLATDGLWDFEEGEFHLEHFERVRHMLRNPMRVVVDGLIDELLARNDSLSRPGDNATIVGFRVG